MTNMKASTPVAMPHLPTTAGVVELRRVLRDALYIVLVASSMGILSNAVRSDRLPLVAKSDYDIMVPCPEPLGQAEAIAPTDPRVHAADSLVIDARAKDEYVAWHLPAAISIPFDWLAEQEQVNRETQRVARDVARSGKHAVVIYGDGGDPDSGHQWAALLNLAGIKNVTYVAGGSAVLGGPAAAKEQP